MIARTSLLTVKKINLVIICVFTYTLSFTQEVENTVDLNTPIARICNPCPQQPAIVIVTK
ncbi:MAG: hypothetical protein ACI93N_000841 [Flavobacteriaceae bacterium]|jgi:hypothetical protein